MLILKYYLNERIKKIKNKKIETVVVNSRVKSHERTVTGEYIPKHSGTLTFTWNNSFSLMTGKSLTYRIDVIQRAAILHELEEAGLDTPPSNKTESTK